MQKSSTPKKKKKNQPNPPPPKKNPPLPWNNVFSLGNRDIKGKTKPTNKQKDKQTFPF